MIDVDCERRSPDLIMAGDGGQMPDNKCSNCIACNYECTYVEAAKVRLPQFRVYCEADFALQKRGPPKGSVIYKDRISCFMSYCSVLGMWKA